MRQLRRALPLPALLSSQQTWRRTCASSSSLLPPSSIPPPSETSLTESSAFLSALLDPPETIPLEDTTRTYSTMDVVEPCARYDPAEPNLSPLSAAAKRAQEAAVRCELGEEEEEGSVRRAHAAGTLWSTFHGHQGDGKEAPSWFTTLCRDLYFRTDSTQSSAGAISPMQRATQGEEVDPFTYIPFSLLDEADYAVGPYVFPDASTYTAEQQLKLCLGNRSKEYVHFANTYAFPERHQIPTSVGTVPARLLVDPASPTPMIYIQLSPDFPPALWLPVKATAAAVRRVLSAFATQAAAHSENHHAAFAERYNTAQRVMELQNWPTRNATGGEKEGDILRFMAYEGRNAAYMDAPLREYENQQEFFLGEYDDPERLLEHLDLCPFLFSIPHLRTVTDLHAERMTPTIDGPGMAPSLYRCVFSKALLLITVQLSAEVKLPPQDPEAFHFMWKDSQVVPRMKIPVFARLMWPTNTRLCGGGSLARRFNQLFQTEFAPDTPVDAVLSLFYVMQWARKVQDFLGVAGMRQRVAELEAAATQYPDAPKLYPGTREIPNPEYTTHERLGMHIQYLSHLGDPNALDTVRALLPAASAPVRMGCAKAALIAGDRELFRYIVSSEPPGRMQHYMTKLVRKRKTRDLVDPEPRLLEDQYEFAAPLWTKRGTRIDRNTLEGAVDAARLLR